MQCVIGLVVMYSIATICNMIEDRRYQSKYHEQRITYQEPAKVDVKLHIGKMILISWAITCCVLQVMSTASNSIA